MQNGMNTSNGETQIRELIANRIEGTCAKDVDRASAGFSSDVVIFDVVGTLRRRGAQSARERAREWFSSFDRRIDFEVAELDLTVGDGVAFSSALNHVRGTTEAGALDMWWRCTTCYREVDGAWKIVHEHNSVPFDPATGKPSLDLRP